MQLWGIAMAVAILAGVMLPVQQAWGDKETPALRLAVCAFETQNADPRLKAEDQRTFLAKLVEERLKELPYVRIVPRPEPGRFPGDVDFALCGEYLPLVNGRYRLSMRLLAHDRSAVASWSDEAFSWRSLIMDSRDLPKEEREEMEPGDRQALDDRRALVTAMTLDVSQELRRQHVLREIEDLRGTPAACRAAVALSPEGKKSTYRTGEMVEVQVTPEKECRVTVLHVRAGGSMRLVCPSRYQDATAAKAGEKFAVSARALAIRAVSPVSPEETRLRIFLTREPLNLGGIQIPRTPEEQLALATALRDALKALPVGSWSDFEVPLKIETPNPIR